MFARDSFPETVGFRALRKGDRIRPFGLGGSKKISDVLIDRKIPAAERPRLGVLTSGEVVLWLVGVMRSDVSPVDERTQNLILVRCIHKT